MKNLPGQFGKPLETVVSSTTWDDPWSWWSAGFIPRNSPKIWKFPIHVPQILHFDSIFGYPLVICYIAIENGHRNSGFSH